MKKVNSEYSDLDKCVNNLGTFYFKIGTYIKHNPYGPAIILNTGHKAYYIDDNFHRIDGPARIFSDGREEYWVNGEIFYGDLEKHPKYKEYLMEHLKANKEHLISII